MSLELKNVIGAFMLGSAIMYGVRFGHKKVCRPTRKNKSFTKSNVDQPQNLKPEIKSFKLQKINYKTENFSQYDDVEGAYIDRGNTNSLIRSLAHILWYTTKSKKNMRLIILNFITS